MSYEPTLIISKKDLDKHEDLLLNGSWQYDGSDEHNRGGEGNKTPLEYIRDVYKREPVKIKGIELFICQPYLTSFNERIREKLTELNVEFAQDN